MDMHIHHRSIRVLWPVLHNELNMSKVSQKVRGDYLIAVRAACFSDETLICSPSQFGGEEFFRGRDALPKLLIYWVSECTPVLTERNAFRLIELNMCCRVAWKLMYS